MWWFVFMIDMGHRLRQTAVLVQVCRRPLELNLEEIRTDLDFKRLQVRVLG